MKIKSSIKLRCNNCSIVKRNKHTYVICKVAKHKQRQG